jgi:very-short-patch-repair endonuclease
VIRAVVPLDERHSRNRIIVTATERTCLDLARAGRQDRLDTALRKGWTTPGELQQSLAAGRGRRGQTKARIAVAEVADNPWSVPERFVHRLFRDSGINGWCANTATSTAGGKKFPDVRFDDIKLILEIDGREYHQSDEQVENDYNRQVLLVDAGWTVLRLTVRQIRSDPAGTVRRVRRIVDRMRSELPRPAD